MLATLTLLPAMLSVLGHKVNRVRVMPRRLVDRGHPEDGAWGRWARFVLRRPIVVAAVGLAIVAVLAVFAPSGLGAREASMYALLLAITTSGPALGVTLLNRLAITLVEVILFAVGLVTWRLSRSRRA